MAFELTAFVGFGLALVALVLGFVALGPLPAVLFSFGFVGGFFVWLAVIPRPPFKVFRWPFYLTLALFALHKIEERQFGFFPALAELTGVNPPEDGSGPALALYGLAGLWLAVPLLTSRQVEAGYLLAYTFFVSMGVTELGHAVFPFMRDTVGYFPGLLTATLLVPAAWWGLWRLSRSSQMPIS